MKIIEVRTKQREEIIDITAAIAAAVAAAGVAEGICTVFVPHTTAGITINENADPDVKADILMALQHAVPDSLPYAHGEGNSTAHVKASLMGSSVSVIVSGGRLALGTWQGICFCEFDGPRSRKVRVRVS
jgi:secondary thiamine-phosphate synthase enzyme